MRLLGVGNHELYKKGIQLKPGQALLTQRLMVETAVVTECKREASGAVRHVDHHVLRVARDSSTVPRRFENRATTVLLLRPYLRKGQKAYENCVDPRS